MSVRILQGDCRAVLRTLPEESVHCCVTSPPYFGLRDYGCVGQIGLEATPDAFVAEMVAVFREVRRVLRDHGTLWLNLGDSYAGSWGARGRGDATNAPRPDFELKHGTAAPSRNGFSTIGVKPKDLMGIPWEVAIALRSDGWYLRPFMGAGTTGLVAERLGRDCIGIEINPENVVIAERRLTADAGFMADVQREVIA